MNTRWFSGIALVVAVSFAQADEPLLPAEIHSPDVSPSSAEVSQSLTVVGYSDSSRQIGDHSITPTEPAMGVQVDYQPFDSNFNMSAASFHTQPAANLNTPVVNRTYLGVGWKQLLDDAQNLGVRVDIGAVYDEKSSQPHKVALQEVNTNNTTTPATSWKPVVSLGVSYRF